MSSEQQAITVSSEQQQAITVIPPGLGMSIEKILDASQDTLFVPWLTLVQGSADAVKKNQPDGVRAGEFVLGGRKRLPDGFRAKPLGVGDQMIARQHATLDQPPLESFVTDDPIWQQVEAARGRNDGSQARVGTDMLLWLPDEGSFAVFAFANTYAREMPDLVAAYKLGHVAFFKSRLVGKKNQWFVPTITSAPAVVSLPTQAAVDQAMGFFAAPVTAYKAQEAAAESPTSRPR